MYYKTILFISMLLISSLGLVKGLNYIVDTYDLVIVKSSDVIETDESVYVLPTIPIEPELEIETDEEVDIDSEILKFEYDVEGAKRWESFFDPFEIIKEWPLLNALPLDYTTVIVTLGNPKIDWQEVMGEDVDPDSLPIPEGEDFNALYCLFTVEVDEEYNQTFFLMGYTYYIGEDPYAYQIDEDGEVYKFYSELNEGLEEESESCLREV